MTVLFAIDSFKGSCTSAEACAWAAEGFRRGWPGAETRCLPVADGGEGTNAFVGKIDRNSKTRILNKKPLYFIQCPCMP